jgi:uncharacterized protein (DUF488 family)
MRVAGLPSSQPPLTMQTAALFTFGYEGLTIDAFIERLLEARVDLILDVRELPLSRKKGFSKTAFRERLAAAGIRYEHWPSLGCPKPIRDQYRADGDWAIYTRGFLAHLGSLIGEVRDLAAITRAKRACLVCYEADYETCHRVYVARAIWAAGGPAVHHLGARTVLADAPASLAA